MGVLSGKFNISVGLGQIAESKDLDLEPLNGHSYNHTGRREAHSVRTKSAKLMISYIAKVYRKRSRWRAALQVYTQCGKVCSAGFVLTF